MQGFTYAVFLTVATVAVTLIAVLAAILSVAFHHTASVTAPTGPSPARETARSVAELDRAA